MKMNAGVMDESPHCHESELYVIPCFPTSFTGKLMTRRNPVYLAIQTILLSTECRVHIFHSAGSIGTTPMTIAERTELNTFVQRNLRRYRFGQSHDVFSCLAINCRWTFLFVCKVLGRPLGRWINNLNFSNLEGVSYLLLLLPRSDWKSEWNRDNGYICIQKRETGTNASKDYFIIIK